MRVVQVWFQNRRAKDKRTHKGDEATSPTSGGDGQDKMLGGVMSPGGTSYTDIIQEAELTGQCGTPTSVSGQAEQQQVQAQGRLLECNTASIDVMWLSLHSFLCARASGYCSASHSQLIPHNHRSINLSPLWFLYHSSDSCIQVTGFFWRWVLHLTVMRIINSHYTSKSCFSNINIFVVGIPQHGPPEGPPTCKGVNKI